MSILGKPISSDMIFPQNSGPLRKYIPSFGEPKVIVSSAITESGFALPELLLNPEGISTEMVFVLF